MRKCSLAPGNQILIRGIKALAVVLIGIPLFVLFVSSGPVFLEILNTGVYSEWYMNLWALVGLITMIGLAIFIGGGTIATVNWIFCGKAE